MYLFLELLGTIAFAISGAKVGIKQEMDILGVTVLGLTTAVGGGVIRDLIIGVTPPMAFQKPIYGAVAIIVSLIVFIPAIRKRINTHHFVFTFIDSIGLAVFTLVGVEAGLAFDNPYLEVFLGVVTGVGGGVMRDLFAMRTPRIFVKHFYATSSIIGAIVCVLLMKVDHTIAIVAGAVVVVVLRLEAAKHMWNLPKASSEN